MKKLRELEGKKGIEIKALLKRKTPYSFGFIDTEFLYDISRSNILEYIDILEKYNPRSVEENRKRTLNLEGEKKIEREDCFNKIWSIAVANGLSGTFGYLFGDSTAKVILAKIADPKSLGVNIAGINLHGWNDVFIVFYVALFIGVILLSFVAYAEEMKIRAAKKK